jgi:hypothetical protein
VGALFSNEAFLQRLATPLLMEISEDWETGKVYLNLQEEDPTPWGNLKKKNCFIFPSNADFTASSNSCN